MHFAILKVAYVCDEDQKLHGVLWLWHLYLSLWVDIQGDSKKGDLTEKKWFSQLSHGVFLSNLELISYDNGFTGARNFKKI